LKKGWWLLWLTAINASAVGADEAMSSATAEYATAAAEVAEAAKRRPFDRRFDWSVVALALVNAPCMLLSLLL